MWIFTCPACQGYLTHDYTIEGRMTCTHCFMAYNIVITLASTDHTDNTNINNYTPKGEHQYG